MNIEASKAIEKTYFKKDKDLKFTKVKGLEVGSI